MTGAIVDTNVLVVADRRHPAAGMDCIAASAQVLQAVTDAEYQIVIDDEERIFLEYRHNVLPADAQPGAGTRFWIWLAQNRFNAEHCQRIHITYLEDSPDGCDFLEFPDSDALAEFDRDDRKFIATALASDLSPPIFEASDAGWWAYREALAEEGIEIRWVCPELMH